MHGHRALVAGNWKMHKTIGQSVAFVREFLALEPELDRLDAVLFPPFTSLEAVGIALAGHRVGLGAQTMHDADQGAFTGEICPAMLLDCGATWVILGHSERRACAGETDAAVNRKVHSALHHGITPIVCVGESAADRASGRAHDHVVAQAVAAFADVAPENVARCVVAYEPLWAIGTGIPDTPPGANGVMREIRAAVPGLERTRILYGGSVKPENIGAFVAQPHIDGALVGGASLEAASFAGLLANARIHAGR
jgi:triosephosphate isomerase